MVNVLDGKKLVCIFAHPDDEAFGPAGTIAKFSERGEVELILVTDGDDKTRPKPKLVEKRKKELEESAEILGIKKIHRLNYKDGELSNNIYHEVAEKIKKILDEVKPDTLMAFEPRGISGHIDHVFCSMVTSYLFEKLPYAKTLLYHAITSERTDEIDDYFIYFPDGYDKDEIDLEVDVSEFWDKKVDAMLAHKSQIEDAERILKRYEGHPKRDYFLVKKK